MTLQVKNQRPWHGTLGFILTLLLGISIGAIGDRAISQAPVVGQSNSMNFTVTVTNQNGQPHFSITQAK